MQRATSSTTTAASMVHPGSAGSQSESSRRTRKLSSSSPTGATSSELLMGSLRRTGLRTFLEFSSFIDLHLQVCVERSVSLKQKHVFMQQLCESVSFLGSPSGRWRMRPSSCCGELRCGQNDTSSTHQRRIRANRQRSMLSPNSN